MNGVRNSPEAQADTSETLCAITRNTPSALSVKLSSPRLIQRLMDLCVDFTLPGYPDYLLTSRQDRRMWNELLHPIQFDHGYTDSSPLIIYVSTNLSFSFRHFHNPTAASPEYVSNDTVKEKLLYAVTEG
ncbi:hypothetical protein C5167_028824 [Papaver somniferum]|nr:hypothetical protein C5167_028824 [Papaver somniferum]